jgi:hypothetical protein
MSRLSPPARDRGRAGLAMAAVGTTLAAVVMFLAADSGIAGATTDTQAYPLETLAGTLRLSPVSCRDGTPNGSFFEVTDGGISYKNADSTCDGGVVTLLPPGTAGIPLGSFAADPDPTFAANGDSRSNLVIQPTSYDGHKLGIGTSPYDVQDAPTGPLAYPPPQALVQGSTLTVDLRSLDVTFEGVPGSTCASAEGQGCWEEGTKAASGTFDPVTHQFTLNWLAGQGFTGQAVGIVFHLQGTLVGQAQDANFTPGDNSVPDPAGFQSAGAVRGGSSTGTGGVLSVPPSGSSPAGAGSSAAGAGSSPTTAGSSPASGSSPNSSASSAGVAPVESAAALPAGERLVASNFVSEEDRDLGHQKKAGALAVLAALFIVLDAFWLGMMLEPVPPPSRRDATSIKLSGGTS